MTDTPRTARWPLWGWYPLALLWLILLLMLGMLTVFRSLKNIGSADLIQFDDVPILHYFDLNYGKLFWGTAGLAAVVLCGLAAACWLLGQNRPGWPWQAWRSRSPRCRVAAWLPAAAAVFALLALIECRYSGGQDAGPVAVDPAGAMGWLIVALAAAAGWLLTRAVVLTPQGGAAQRRGGKGTVPVFVSAKTGLSPSAEKGTVPFSLTRKSGQSPAWLGRLATVFLLCLAISYIEAASAHRKFWNQKANGNHDYRIYFAEDELPTADLVLHSTSMLFVTLAAMGGCAWFAVFHWAVPSRRRSLTRGDCMWIVGLMAALWTFALGVPWQIKLLPEIKAEDGWILTGIVLVFLPAALAPLLAVTLMMLRQGFSSPCATGEPEVSCATAVSAVPESEHWQDASATHSEEQRQDASATHSEEHWQDASATHSEEHWQDASATQSEEHWQDASATEEHRQDASATQPRASEFALWTLVLFPLYPLLAWLPFRHRRGRYAFLAIVAAAVLGGMLSLVTHIDDWFTFDDWRGMLKGAEFPFLKVFAALMVACGVYLLVRRAGILVDRWLDGNQQLRGLRWVRVPVQAVVILAAAACLFFASWPFWGWGSVPKNVFARCVEFNKRHTFELGFLHWIFDCDRDGYSAVLHGADPDDFDSQIQAGGLGPSGEVVIPVDHFAIDDRTKAQQLPNLVIFYLEGVHPRSIGAYGQRRRYGKDGPTPHIDSVASEGTVFTQARCFYPSTWDAWYATSTGRFMRIAEMHAARLFGDRYSPHNNLYKVLYLAGFDRWCHADTSPYDKLLVPPKLHAYGKPAWDPDFDSRLTKKEEEREVWRGDKRADRMVAFLDDIRPGERFFMCEHMADTHFTDTDTSWRTTSDERARELGFPNGLVPYTEDAYLNSDTYRAYLQTLTRMDAQIGRVLDRLRQRRLYDNTLIVIVSDHGCQWWEHEHMYYVSHIYEQSLLVPLIIRLPPAAWEKYGFSRAQRAKQYDEAVLQVDILPTVMELAGARHLNAETTGPLPGRSLLPAMFSKGKSQAELDALAAGYRQRDIPLMTHYDMRGVIHDARYKLIFDRAPGTYMVFDLVKDPKEMKNLADAEPELLDDLLERFRVLFTTHKTLLGRMEEDESWGP